MDESDLLRLQDILEYAVEAMGYLEEVPLDAYLEDRRLQLVNERLLEILGEAARAISAETRSLVDVDWRGIIGLRNILTHQYGRVDHPSLYLVVKRDLPLLVERVTPVIDAEEADRGRTTT